MDRPLMPALHDLLIPEGGGGVIDRPEPLDMAALAATANEFGARFIVLDGPGSRSHLVAGLVHALGLRPGAGQGMEELEAALGHPEPDHAGPIVIAWDEPSRLPAEVGVRLRSLVERAAHARAQAGDGSLVLVVGPPSDGPPPAVPAVPPAIAALGKVHHVALIVASIEDALGLWRDILRAPLESILEIEHDRVRIAFLTVGESKIELVEPTDDTTGVARFLASKGEGFHHVCFEVANLAETLLRLEIDGLELIDSAPRRGAEGPVAFIHPRACHGVLVELIETPGGPSWDALGYPAPAARRQP
jgi:methylmalonyl-CoA/ethylmalonyl-CoA epimerase